MQISRSKQLVRVREWALRQLEQLSILLTAVVTADSKTTLDEMRKLSAFLIYRQVYLWALRCLTTVVTNQALISLYLQRTMGDRRARADSSVLAVFACCGCLNGGGKLVGQKETNWMLELLPVRGKERFNAVRYARIRDVLCSLTLIFLH